MKPLTDAYPNGIVQEMRLDECCRVVAGGTPDTSTPKYWDGNIAWVTPKDLGKNPTLSISNTERKISDEGVKNSSAEVFPAGSVILSSRAPIGYVAVCSTPMSTNQGCKTLVPKTELIDSFYLAHWLISQKGYLQSLGVGATFKEISKSAVSAVKIRFPSLPEQKRIAAILDEADRQRSLAKQQLAEFDKLAEAVFVDMFGDLATNEKGWKFKKIRDYAIVKIGPFGSLLHVEDYVTGGYPLVNPTHIVNGGIVTDNDLTLSDAKFEELNAYRMSKGDLVIGRRGEIGRCAVVEQEGYLCGTGSMFVHFHGEYLPQILQRVISSSSMRKKLESQAVGVTMKNLNSETISNFEIPAYPFPLQLKFAKMTEQIEAQRIAARLSLEEASNLFDVLMQQAFTTDLL